MQTYTLTEAPRAMKDVQAHVEQDKVVLLTSRGRPELAVCQLPGYTDPGMFTIVGH